MTSLSLPRRDLSEIPADSFMVVPRFFPSSTLPSIRSPLYTTGPLLLLTAYAWSLLEFAMAVVRPRAAQKRATTYTSSSGKPSEVYTKCLQEVQTISCATLFAPVIRVEAVQAMSASLLGLGS